VLLDMDLGEAGSGLDLVAPLRETGARVLVLTGSTDRIVHAACVEAGAVGIVGKSEGLDALRSAVEHLLRDERLMPVARREELLLQLHQHRRADREREARFGCLTPRECDVLARMMRGEAAATIAEASFVSLATVRSQIRSILQKLGVSSQLAAVAAAYEAGWRHDPAPMAKAV
jgi:DNA-binding NarL/FixJ family response regulator